MSDQKELNSLDFFNIISILLGYENLIEKKVGEK